MALNLPGLAQVLEASLDPTQNKQAEIVILHEEKKPNFSLSLLQIVDTAIYGPTARLASALYFKNYIKRHWTDEDGNHKLPQNEVTAIKRELIGLMISVPPNIQYQLGDAIGVIADSDFWEKWDSLVDDLVSRLTPNNPTTNNGVLQVAHSIFKRWQPLYRSDPLFTEINHVLGKFGNPFLSLVQSTDALIDQNQTNRATLLQLFATLNLIVKLFYDLSVQDLPPVFEDSLPAVTSLLHKYLTYENDLLQTDDDSEAGPLEHVKSGIFEILELWIKKYEDAVGVHVGQFISSSWNLLTTVGPQAKYDILVSKALQFLTAVTSSTEHAQAFNDDSTLSSVVERVILPNLTLRDSDMELFEDEPIEFIRRDLEGSDSDTRRRAATDFLRQLMAKFEGMVSTVVLQYIDHYLSDYSKNPASNWKAKDTAVYLYSSTAARGTITASQGVTSVNNFANVIEFFQNNIAGDLVSDTGVEPILQVDAIKYLYMFRSQITTAQWQDAFPLVVKHLGSSNYVVYTYAAIALERTMALSNASKQPVIGRVRVESLSAQLLRHLFGLIEKDPEPAKLQENEFLMRCVMRVLVVVREAVVPIVDEILAHFVKITQISSQNPSNPRFCYYLFEALGAFIRFGAPSQPYKLENGLYVSFIAVIQDDVQEFIPYVFQLFAALLEANTSGSLSDYYKNLILPILTPALWAPKGNVPALVRLLSSIISRGSSVIAQNNQIETVLGIFQSLASTKTNETYGFELLESIVANFPPSTLEQYYPSILNVLLNRLQNTKTEPFASRFVRLYHFISAKDDEGLGADFFISKLDQVQEGLFVPLYLNIILPNTQKLLRPLDRKTAVISFTKTLTNSVAFAEKYKKGWAYTCEALLKLLENPPIPAATEDTIVEQDPDDMSFGVGFTQLTTIKRPVRDQWPEIRDVKRWVSEYVGASDARQNGKIASYAQDRLAADVAPAFAAYMQR
ncbi:MAG: importin-alpha export receptor [Alectoria fallacina]|uniref:Importin-alpha export receptor n=1 Tax=Alectoria fallacina TaxID=1903189 RepID=A0A8H3EZT3_9LECA|nr:MAG: importin-alpha export receptor [Alectoria fallacina]